MKRKKEFKTNFRIGEENIKVIFKSRSDDCYYGVTFYKEKEIHIFVDTIREYNESISRTLFHEMGHAFYNWFTTSHAYDNCDKSNIFADGFEYSWVMRDRINEVVESFEKWEKQQNEKPVEIIVNATVDESAITSQKDLNNSDLKNN